MGGSPHTTPINPTDATPPCRDCGRDNPPGEAFCTACGAALDDAAAEPPLPPLPPGTRLAGLYVIETAETFGHENHYRAACDDDSGRAVAIRERQGEAAGRLRALLERTQGVTHPALLVPEHVFEHEERTYLVCPRAAGVCLASRVGRTGEREAAGWGVQLCQMAGLLHRRGLLCVELPPENLLLDKDGRLLLTRLDALAEKGAPAEDPHIADGYAAPEVYKAAALNEQADVFAVGAALYSLVVGKRLPVEGWVVQYEAPEFYPEKVVTPGFERVLRKALAPDPKDRYEHIDAFKAALLALGQASRVRSAWLTDVGQVRDHNEDAVFVSERGQGSIAGNAFAGLYLVSDGMGGAEAGEVASALAVQTVARHVEQAWGGGAAPGDAAWETCLRAAIEAANAAVVAYGKEHPESAGLGATVAAALVQGQRVTAAWVGDSRVYLWERGRLTQLSRDHSLVARLVEIGQLSAEAARSHEHRNVLIRSLGAKEQVVVDALSCPLRRGARLLLCSDGLTSHVGDAALADIVSRHRDPGEAVLELVVAANAGGGSDNVSAVVVFHE